MSVRRASADDVDGCKAIAAGLPQFFSVDVLERIAHDLESHGGWVVTRGDSLRGFAVVQRRSPRAAEIIWAAVDATDRNRGLGKILISGALAALRESGVRLVEVKTLDPTAGYEPYLATHAFWLACGFEQIDVIDPLPGWQPGNPSSILVAALDRTVSGRGRTTFADNA